MVLPNRMAWQSKGTEPALRGLAQGLPKFLWAEAVHHSIWLGMWTPSCALPEFITPFKKATGHKPNFRGVLEWGIPIWVKKADARKLDLHAMEGCFVGYNEEAKGYQVFWAARRSVSIEWDIYVDKDTVLKPRDVVFEGGNLPTINATSPEVSNPTVPDSQSNEDTPPPAEMPTVNPSPTPETPNFEPSTTSKVQQCRNSLAGLPQFDEATYGHGKHQSGKGAAFVENALAVNAKRILEPGGAKVEPFITGSDWFHKAVHDTMSAITEDQPHINEAIKGPEANQWKDAIEVELTQIEKLGTWKVVEAPPDTNIIDSRFVLHQKRDAQGNISRYKACLVTKGFKQQFGVDYTDTFAPTVRTSTLWVLLSIARSLGNKVVVEQADAKNVYLNSWLHNDEVIYMYRPQNFETFCSLPMEFTNKPRKMIVLWLR